MHRDIKPDHVLVFQSTSGSYVVKVTDFGWSIEVREDTPDVQMPLSKPWDAPEWHHRKQSARNAFAMDCYSAALVCLFVLFTAEFPFSNLCPEDVRKMKKEDRLRGIATNLVLGASGLDARESRDLSAYFDGCLALEASRRVSGLAHFPGLERLHRLHRLRPGKTIVAYSLDRTNLPVIISDGEPAASSNIFRVCFCQHPSNTLIDVKRSQIVFSRCGLEIISFQRP